MERPQLLPLGEGLELTQMEMGEGQLRIIADAGELLILGGILVASVPARSAWDGTMISH